ncbi:MAG: GNAT family N-acetyltransferase [Candidatus Aminicenantales bacterium]|jgi:N-acetylglutamate synthase-like GNAT family acetyltransferase
MRVRKALPEDIPQAVSLAGSLGLDYPGMDKDRIWVAEEDRRIVGIVGLKKHPDCLELCALGIEAAHRGRGVAKALVATLMAEAPGDVHLATVIPGFFETCGFEKAAVVPATFPEKRRTSWCEGCDARLCTVMVRKVS